MLFPTPLTPARLVRRYKRFLADVILPDGSDVTVHCPNPGSMLGLAEPGMTCWLSDHRGSSRKMPFGWELVDVPPMAGRNPKTGQEEGGSLVGINTGLANAIVAEALAAKRVPALADYDDIRREVKVGLQSRLDFQLRTGAGGAVGATDGDGSPICYVEVKSVTLSRRQGLAEFPDARTSRGVRHLLELADLAATGYRAMLLFLVQRDDCSRVRPAADIDPVYAATLRQIAGTVEIRAYGCAFTIDQGHPTGITLADEIPVEIP